MQTLKRFIDRVKNHISKADDFECISSLELTDAEVLGVGRNRLAIVDPENPNFVLKIPLSLMGDLMNFRESTFASEDESGNLANCFRKTLHGLDVLCMERLEPADNILELQKKYPWVLSVDCAQVGWTPNQELKAYDFGG